jgi:hypothetical protein
VSIGKIKVKPMVDSALEASVKTSSDSPFSFVLHERHRPKPMTHIHTTKQQPRTAELNRSFITKLSKIIFPNQTNWLVGPERVRQAFVSGSRNIGDLRLFVNGFGAGNS